MATKETKIEKSMRAMWSAGIAQGQAQLAASTLAPSSAADFGYRAAAAESAAVYWRAAQSLMEDAEAKDDPEGAQP